VQDSYAVIRQVFQNPKQSALDAAMKKSHR